MDLAGHQHDGLARSAEPVLDAVGSALGIERLSWSLVIIAAGGNPARMAMAPQQRRLGSEMCYHYREWVVNQRILYSGTS